MTIQVHVFTDANNHLADHYLISKLAWHWKRRGFGVVYSPTSRTKADLSILHLDRTRIPPAIIPSHSSNRPLLNGRVLDISKSSFSTLRVLPSDPWDGPVIIKTDSNHFGAQEWRQHPHAFFEQQRRRFARVSWRLARMLPPGRYPILPKLSQVPDWVWENTDLIVERFMPEREGSLYCLRGWVFFGKRGYTYRLFSKDNLIKIDNMTGYEFLQEPPPELITFRDTHGFDFGKFDYVVIDGRPILLDINKTPTISTDPDTPRLRYLAEGIDELLGES